MECVERAWILETIVQSNNFRIKFPNPTMPADDSMTSGDNRMGGRGSGLSQRDRYRQKIIADVKSQLEEATESVPARDGEGLEAARKDLVRAHTHWMHSWTMPHTSDPPQMRIQVLAGRFAKTCDPEGIPWPELIKYGEVIECRERDIDIPRGSDGDPTDSPQPVQSDSYLESGRLHHRGFEASLALELCLIGLERLPAGMQEAVYDISYSSEAEPILLAVDYARMAGLI